MVIYNDILKGTERLEIRPLKLEDYKVWLRGFKEQNESQSPYDEGWFDTAFITEEWYAKKLKEREELGKKDSTYMLNIFRKEDRASIGYCDITTHMREDFQYARVGYTIHNQFWNKGYGKESIKALVSIGFEDLNFHRLEAHINLDNIVSKKVILSAGFQFEGIREKFILEDNEWIDNEIYYIINCSWKYNQE